MVATLCLDSYAVYGRDLGESQEPAIENQEVKESPAQEPVETKNLLAIEENKGLEISREEVKQPVGEPQEEKTFTVTKRPVDNPNAEEELIGNYDTFHQAIGACKQEQLETQYIVTMNKDYTVPEDESMWGKSSVNMILRSKEGSQFTLKRTNRNIMSLSPNATLEVENVILDGSNKTEAISVLGGTLTLGKDAVVQNFMDTPNFDGPAILVSSDGTLNILEGAIIQNNESEKQGGAIQVRNGSTINISGGTFKNNKSNKSDGGVLAAYGTLNVTGGTFEGNSAKKTGGAIIIGSRATANIKNATFKENKASTGGAVYALNAISITDTVFEENEANWGGAIFTVSGLELNNIRFSGNKADKQGGAIYLQKGNANITESTFTKNESKSGGGAIFIADNNKGTTSISKTSFTENVSSAFGGGIYLGSNGKLEVSESEFTQNQTTYGAGISSANSENIDIKSTSIKVDSTSFKENISLIGAGIFTAFPTEITRSKFIKNDAVGAGGALSVNGVTKDKDGKITGIRDNIRVNITGRTEFIANTCGIGEGGAIYTIPHPYDLEWRKSDVDLKPKAYENLTIAEDTVFKDNIALLRGFFNPPENYEDYKHLKFARNSFTEKLPDQDVAKSLLNNYDVNYMNEKISAIFNPNGGEFTEGQKTKDIRVVKGEKDKEITILDSPKREGYKFTGWKCSNYIPQDIILQKLSEEGRKELKEGKIYKSGDKFKLDSNYIFIAQWEKEDKPTPKPDNKPTPKPDNRPTPRGSFAFVGPTPLLNKEDHAQYLMGYQDRTFGAENKMTREEVAVMFSRLLKNPPQKGQVYSYDFSDVARDRWSITAISYMNQLGIIKGYPDGTFKPEASITRAEFAAMAARFADLKEGTKTFTDLDKNYWAYDLVQRAASAGWITGYPDGTFKPDKNITRAEVVAITNRMLDRKADQDFVDQNLGKLLQFNDLDKSYWAYYPILEATNGHDYTRHENKLDEHWKEITAKTFVYDK